MSQANPPCLLSDEDEMRAFSVLLCAILVATASGWGWGGKKDADKVAWDFTDPEADHFGQAIEWDEAGQWLLHGNH